MPSQKHSSFLNALTQGTLLLDGAMGTQTQSLDLDIEKDYLGCENCTDILSLSRPDAITKIHNAYLAAGADAITTNTFGGAVHTLAEFDLQDRCYELNKAAAQIARAAADEFATPDQPRFVLGDMGPGTKLISLGQISFDAMFASYRTAAHGLIEGNVDAILIETCQDLLQVKCAIAATRAAATDAGINPDDLPIMVSVTIEQTGTMLLGSTIDAAIETLRPLPIASLGLNCATGPVEMVNPIRTLLEKWDRPVTIMPNAGLPILVEGETIYPLKASGFVDAMRRFLDSEPVNAIGGCCGTTPEYTAALREAIGARPTPQRAQIEPKPAATSLYSITELRQDTSVLIVGERCNSSGSRAFKRLLEAEDWEGITALARNQLRDGSHILDINVDVAGRNGPRDMHEIVSRFTQHIDAPLMFDSTAPATLEAGLKASAGRGIINSANFEDGEEKFDEICTLAKNYGAALVIGTIDEDPEEAMARTADRKIEIASRAINRAREIHGLQESDLFIDPLVLPISTGLESDRRSALELIEGTKRIAQAFPDVHLTCGLSNCSFGLKPAARVVLNAVLLHELQQAGMTSGILHASKIIPLHKIDPEQRQAALDLIYDRRTDSFDPLQHFIELFSDIDESKSQREEINRTLEEQLQFHIVDGDNEHLTTNLDKALETYTPLEIINDHLLAGMKTVGELFGAGEMQLPFVLQSAAVMKQAVAHLEPHMEKVEGQTKGTIVLATVKGDVHDIGKNLVDILLTNNGYTVHNIGIKQTIDNILKAFDETKADAIGLSGLLVKSVNVMEDNLRELNTKSISVPVLLGGAALTRTYAEGHLSSVYEGPLLYAKDAFDGLHIMDKLMTGAVDELTAAASQRQQKHAAAKSAHTDKQTSTTSTAIATRADLDRSNPITDPPFWGSTIVEKFNLRDIFAYINPTALFAVQWQLKRGSRSKAEYEQLLADKAHPVFEQLKQRCIEEDILRPAVAYGYFPCSSDNDDLIIYDPKEHDRELLRFTFPRQRANKHLCIADFYKDLSECDAAGKRDVFPVTCVTMGHRITELTTELFESADYQQYLYMHGMGVESAEALAELWHKRIRTELGFAHEDSPNIPDLFKQSYRGSRYSFGYPACPDMSDQEKIWTLIDPTRIGCTLTENHQIDPEQSTSAIVTLHPQARYFNA